MGTKRLELSIVPRKGWEEHRRMPKGGKEGIDQCFAVIFSLWLFYLTRVKNLWA